MRLGGEEMKNVKKYTIVSEVFVCEEGPCLCYGIRREDDAIRHISTDRVFVEMVTEVVNRLDLDPQRARDLIESLLP